jgi:hypothetical protein
MHCNGIVGKINNNLYCIPISKDQSYNILHIDKVIICVTIYVLVVFMVFNATFNNISVISWRSVLLVEETGLTEENHRTVASH